MSEREEFSGPNYKERLDISQVFLRQLDRTNFSAAAKDGSFEEYVRQTRRRLPIQWKQWVRDQADRYEKTEMVLKFRKYCGVRMGKQSDPLVVGQFGKWGLSSEEGFSVNLLEDGSVDWSDPRIVSPTLSEKTTIDYEMLDEIVGEAAEYAGISWQAEKIAGDRGSDSIKREKTPYRRQKEDEQEEISNPEGT